MTKSLRRSNLREEHVILDHGLRRWGPSWWEVIMAGSSLQLVAEEPGAWGCLLMSQWTKGQWKRNVNTDLTPISLFILFGYGMDVTPPSPSKLMARLTLIPLLIPLWNCLHRLSQKYVTLMSEAFLNLINLAIKINHHTHMLTQLFLSRVHRTFFLMSLLAETSSL